MSAISSASSFNDRINAGMATSSLAASSAQFGQELMAKLNEYIKNETENSPKGILGERSERLEEALAAANEEREGHKCKKRRRKKKGNKRYSEGKTLFYNLNLGFGLKQRQSVVRFKAERRILKKKTRDGF